MLYSVFMLDLSNINMCPPRYGYAFCVVVINLEVYYPGAGAVGGGMSITIFMGKKTDWYKTLFQ